MSNLFTLEYWFSVNPGALSSLGFYVLVIFVALFLLTGIASMVLKRKKSVYRGVYNSIYDFSVVNFILGLVFLFFHYENIPFFTARFWFIAWLLGIALWIYFIVKKVKRIPEKRKELEREQEMKKYLP